MNSAIIVQKNPVLDTVRGILGNRFFPFATATLVTACYYLGWDVAAFYYLALTGILAVVFLDNLVPLVSNFLFINVTVSCAHSPSTFGNPECPDYFLQPAIFAQLIALIALYVIAIFIRIAFTVKRRKFKLTPEFFGLCALAVAFLLNGLFSSGYSAVNLAYGIFMAFCFLGIFSLMKDNVDFDEKSLETLAYSFLAFSVVLVLELYIKYATCDVVVDGKINRQLLGFGWGMYNNMGMLMMLCLPSIMYLAGKSKYGYLFFVYAIVHALATVMTMSRQSIICVAIIFPVCLILLLVKGKNRLVNSIITGVCATALIILAILFHRNIASLFEILLEANLTSGNGRFTLWEEAWTNFLSSPVFGKGFYVELDADPGFAGIDLIPDMYHNTFFQLLGSCGIVGLMAYLAHRTQTVVSFFKNVTINRTYIALTILTLLIVNLLDNHLFYISPTIIYSCLLAILIKSRKTTN